MLTDPLPNNSGYFIEYLLSRPDVQAVWSQYVHHPFVMAMGDGTLPLDSFKGYIIQDYLYLVRFSSPLRCLISPRYRLSLFLNRKLGRQLLKSCILTYHMRKLQIQFARANALAAYKSNTMTDISRVIFSAPLLSMISNILMKE